VDKKSLVFREFTSAVKRRKRLLARLEEMGNEQEQSSGMLKRYLLELRSLTLALIEDALEIEYRSKVTGSLKGRSRGGGPAQLPPLAASSVLEDKDDIYMLAELLTDTDDLLQKPNIRVFLPYDFPHTRNTFMLGKSIDELATMDAPTPQQGNLDHELKVLELLRYRRAARALLKAETQALNKLPITLTGLDDIYKRSVEDADLEVVLRVCMTILVNDDGPKHMQGPELGYLNQFKQLLESHVFMNMLNVFQFKNPVRLDVQASIRSTLAGCNYSRITQDNSVSFLVEWINSALSRTGGGESMGGGASIGGGFSTGGGLGSTANSLGPSDYPGDNHGQGHTGGGVWAAQTMQHQQQQQRQMMGGSISMDGLSVGDISVLHMDGDADELMSRADDVPHSGAAVAFSPIKGSQMEGDYNNSTVIKKTMGQGVDLETMKERRIDAVNGKSSSMAKRKGKGVKAFTQSVDSLPSTASEQKSDVDNAALQAIRYELLRMQQELLRRKVLDPKHYKAVSIDTTQHGNKKRLRNNIAALTHKLDEDENGDAGPKHRETIIAHKAMKNEAFPVQLELAFEPLSETVVARAVRIHDARSIMDNPLFSVGDKEILYFYQMSKLTFNRLSDQVLDELLDMPPGKNLNPKLNTVYNVLKAHISYDEDDECTYPEGQLPLEIDWKLFHQTMVISGSAINLDIVRNNDDSGLLVSVQPVKTALMKVEAGPVTLSLHDSELLVLLINQRGLYRLARSKWNCMQMVAQWLTNRLEIKRIYVGDGGKNKQVGNGNNMGVVRKEESMIGSLDGSISLLSASKSAVLEEGASEALVPINSVHDDDGDMDPSDIVLDVDIDRGVDVNSAAKMQWMSRHTPKLEQVHYKLAARQEMELLVFSVDMLVPDEYTRFKKKQETQLLDFAAIPPYFQTEDFFEESQSVKSEKPHDPIRLTLSTRLTGFEIGIFGVAKIMDDHQVALSAKTTGAPNPSDFMWNVINRMNLTFRGDRSDPYKSKCSAEDVGSWVLDYDRRLLRDIRTVSGGVMVISVTAVGNELLFDADPTNGSIFEKVGNKLMSNEEILDIVLAEGWPMALLQPGQRLQLAYRIVERLKVVQENGRPRIEFYSYPERRMLQISISNGVNRPETAGGSVEINEHITLNDLRTLITHELDKEVVPRLYRFQYKGGVCAVRQEQFRRAWELFPKATIMPRKPKEDDDEKKKKEAALRSKDVAKGAVVPKVKEVIELKPEQRRVSARLVPVPVRTLGRVEEETGNIFLLHDSRDHIVAGDIIRVGDIRGRDYIVAGRQKRQQQDYPNLIMIKPEFSMMYEDEFDIPIMGNLRGPKKSMLTYDMQEWYPSDHGMKYYDLKVDKRGKVIKADKAQPSWKSMEGLGSTNATTTGTMAGSMSGTGPLAGVEETGAGAMVVAGDMGGMALGSSLEGGPSVADAGTATSAMEGDRNLLSEVEKAQERSLVPVPAPEKVIIWQDVWLWKCVPPEEDERPRWRVAYDNADAEIEYKFEYQYTPDDEEEPGVYFFRYFCKYQILEILCMDVRLPETAAYQQRVDEMELFPVDWYTKMAFTNMCNWFPSHRSGIDMNKWLKMCRDIRVFPDFKKPARMGQCENIFIKEMKGEHGIMEKYITYEGFCRCMQEIALIRFPPALVAGENFDDLSSVGIKSGATDGDFNDEASAVTMETSKSSVGSKSARAGSPGKKSPTRIGAKKGKKNMGKSKRDRDREANLKAAEVNNDKPVVDPVEAAIAYRKLVVNYIMNIPEWSKQCWKDAKIAAMKREGRKFAAVSRIIAMWRGRRGAWIYKNLHRSMTKMQGHARRRAAMRRVKIIIGRLFEDWLFRARFRAATLFNSLVRKYLTRCRHVRTMWKLINDQIKIFRMRRKRKKKLRKKERMSVLFREVKRIGGMLILLKIERKDKRNYSKDYSVVVVAYLPTTQDTFKFEIDERDLRMFMCLELKQDAVSVGDLVDKTALEMVINARLMCKPSPRPGMRPQVVFSRQALGQKGLKVLTCGRIISNDLFVVSLYESGTEMSAQCYHRLTSKVFTCYITTPMLVEWVASDYRLRCKNEIDRHKEPPLLKPAMKKQLYRWVAERILADTRHRTFRVIFACQLEKSQKSAAIRMVQCLWRKAIARSLVPGWLDYIYIKVNAQRPSSDPREEVGHYYIDRRTGTSFWEKPKLLRSWDLPTKPNYQWIDISFYDDEGYLSSQFVNPYTGDFSRMSIHRAASAIQTMVRKFQIRPFRLSINMLEKALLLRRGVYDSYELAPHKLANIMNLAFCKQLFEDKEEEARDLFIKAMELSDANPLVTRAYAIFLLGTCDPPLAFNRDKALRLFQDASRRDEKIEKFTLAYDVCYRFALLRKPRNYKLLLALGVAEFFVYEDKSKAERLLRRAVSIAPFEDRIIQNWKLFREEFPEQKFVHRPKADLQLMNTASGGKKQLVHGHLTQENSHWAGWTFVESDPEDLRTYDYWYNPATGESTYDEPVWYDQWLERKLRSKYEREEDNLEYYFDPLTSSYFQYHVLTDTFI
jgi:hypothetical protein